jgi:acetyltransferase-like isoleucine patch superfamily enzyme
MTFVERLLARLLARPIDESIHKALAQHVRSDAHGFDADEFLSTYLVFGDRSRLHIHPTAVVNNALFNLESGEVTVDEYAFFGHNVSVLTGTHDADKFGRARQSEIPRSGRDVRVKEGAWVASDVLVLGPCVIGEHAVVAAGSLVVHDVEPFTIVAGRPARTVRRIERVEGR